MTGETREDWWWRFEGKTIGCHPNMVEEINEKAHVQFYLYSPDRFIEYAQPYLEQEVDQVAVDEIRAIRHSDEDLLQVTEQLEITSNFLEAAQVSSQLEEMRRATQISPQVLEAMRRATQISPQVLEEMRRATQISPQVLEAMRRATQISPQVLEEMRRATQISPQVLEAMRRATQISPQVLEEMRRITQVVPETLRQMRQTTRFPPQTPDAIKKLNENSEESDSQTDQ